ncbi:unnamed protein product [Clonostachys rhizophaga]|uniref:Uncharacterized protein n=1 Tax=Clonostachys rhizophaga TaxID=160324 RepID=A0A9N9VUP2_9HYPO|nr:unnamed protein product [Clonostachys rhizophaga]
MYPWVTADAFQFLVALSKRKRTYLIRDCIPGELLHEALLISSQYTPVSQEGLIIISKGLCAQIEGHFHFQLHATPHNLHS